MEKRGFLITKNEAKEVTFVDNVDELHRILNCDCFTVVERFVGGKLFDIVLDDEGLLKPNFISAHCVDYVEAFMGNLLLVKHDGRGNFKSLTDDEISLIKKNVDYYVSGLIPNVYPVLKYGIRK